MDNHDGGRSPGRRPVRFSAALGRRICLRVTFGERQMVICAEEGMPRRPTLWRWVKEMPKFAPSSRAPARRRGVAAE